MEKNKNQTNERRPLPGTPFLKNKVFFRLQSGRFAHRSLSVWIEAVDAHPPYNVLYKRDIYNDSWVNATAGEVFSRQYLAEKCSAKIAEQMGNGLTRWTHYRRAGASAWVRGMACNQQEVELIERLLNEFSERVKACMNQAEADELEKLIMGDDE